MRYFIYAEPKSEKDLKCKGDCMIRSITLATNSEYSEVYKILFKYGWRTTRKSSKESTHWELQVLKTLEELGYKATRMSFPAKKGESRMSGITMAQNFSDGIYLLRMARHLSCLKNGYIYDKFDCTYKCVYFAWKLEKI